MAERSSDREVATEARSLVEGMTAHIISKHVEVIGDDIKQIVDKHEKKERSQDAALRDSSSNWKERGT